MTIRNGTDSNELRGFAGLSGLTSDVDAFVAAATERATRQGPLSRSADDGTAIQEGGLRRKMACRCGRGAAAARLVAAGPRGLWRDDPVNDICADFPNAKTSRSIGWMFVTWLSRSGQSLPISLSRFRPSAPSSVLNPGQIRYCLSEDVRLEAAKEIVTDDADIDRFNALVDDYNSRCTRYRYRRDGYEAMQRLVATRKTALKAEGKARFQHEESR